MRILSKQSNLAARLALFATAYLLATRLGDGLSFSSAIATFWPAGGVWLSVLLLTDSRRRGRFLAVGFLATVAYEMAWRDPGRTLAAAAALGLGRTMTAAAAAWALGAWASWQGARRSWTLRRVSEVVAFVAIAGIGAPLLGSAVGAVGLRAAGGSSQFLPTWILWGMGDAIGLLIVAPLLLVWRSPSPGWRLRNVARQWSLRRKCEAAAVAICVTAMSVLAFRTDVDVLRAFHFCPVMLWAAMRFGRHGATAAVTMVGWMAIWGLADETGVFVANLHGTLQGARLETFLATTVLTSLLFAASLEERRRAEDGRQRHSNLLTAVLESTTDAVFVKDLQGRYLTINQAGADFLGRPIDQVIGLDDTSLFTPETAATIMGGDRRVMNGPGPQSYEEVGTSDGVTRVYHTTKAPYRGPDGETIGLLGISRDVSASRRTLDSLASEERRFRTITMHMPVGIFESNADGECIYVNPRWCEMTGLSPHEALGMGWARAIHPADRAPVWDGWRAAVETEQDRCEMEYRFQAPDGRIAWIIGMAVAMRDVSGKLIGYMGSCVDITDRKNVEEALRESDERFRQMADTIPEVFWLREAEPFRFLYINSAYEKITGRSCADLMKDPFSFLEAIHPDDRQMMIDLSLTPTVAPTVASFRSITADGALKYMRMRLSPVLDRNGALSRLAGIAFDVTELTLTEMALEDANRQLEIRVAQRTTELIDANQRLLQEMAERSHAQEIAHQQQLQLAHVSRLCTIGEMVAELAHEINQPLSAIRNYLFGTLHDLKPEAPVGQALIETLKLIDKESERVANIVRRVRNFSRRGEPQRESFDLNELVRGVVRLVSYDASHRGIALTVRLDERLPRLDGDPLQIEQVVVNLLRNAFDAFDDREGDGERDSEKKQVMIETARGENGAQLSVRDNGPGISDEFRERLFEPFFTTKHDGLGLGLAISRSIIEAHQGRLSAESNPPRGTVFRFTLPLGEETPCNKIPSSTSSTTTPPL